MTASEQLQRDLAFGFLNRNAESEQLFHPLLVSNTGDNTMLRAIRAELRRSHSCTFSVAFITPHAIALLKQAFLDFEGSATIITSTYLSFNSPGVFRELMNLHKVRVFVLDDTGAGFHAKGYVFEQDHTTTAIVGSSNLTSNALLKNQEWNLRFSALPDGDVVEQLNSAIAEQRKLAVPLTEQWIEAYEKTYVPPPKRSSFTPTTDTAVAIVPNTMQAEALEQIARVRGDGESRAVVVSATGTGKTILAALDVRAFGPRHMLFVVHREQILNSAIADFQRVLGVARDEIGKFVGQRRELDRKYVFATMQSLARPENLNAIERNEFDYILIDEVHRAGASSYRRLIDHFTPDFLLGVTATPERTDDFNVFELFDYNVPYEIRLQKALEEDMLAPFHYYGVTDFERDGEVIDDTAVLALLVAPERADHLVRALETYGHAAHPVRGLMFCSRADEAAQLSALLNIRQVHGRTLRTTWLTGADSVARRDDAVGQLNRGELDYIITVDIFNEGIDIPTVNQVVMLRNTQSSIIFTQQLGRGLRKAVGKDHLIVIDFIGNYSNNYLIPIALFGDSSLNKDVIRKKLLDAQDAGAIAGLSSVNFDKIARERVFASIAATKLDSMRNLKQTVAAMRQRLGRTPMLIDFARFDAADPVVLATRAGNYWALLEKFKAVPTVPSEAADKLLTFLSTELLNGKRPHELLLLQRLLDDNALLDAADIQALFDEAGCTSSSAVVQSVLRVLAFNFFTAAEREKYGAPLIESTPNGVFLAAAIRDIIAQEGVENHLRDIIETGLYLARHKYQWSGELEVGHRYSRKDVCRLLNWTQNEQSTMYGYKVDHVSQSCPIFVTYHKQESVSASTAYGDRFINESALHWFTRSKRTLTSSEIQPILDNLVPLHLFAKKDDAEGTDFYYLGEANASSPKQTTMRNDSDKEVPVVTMTLTMKSAIESNLYDYLVSRQPA